MLNAEERAAADRASAAIEVGAEVGRVCYWRAKCDKCSWSGGDMLFRSEAEQEARAHNGYAHAPTGDMNCVNRGEMHIGRHRPKLGKQRCRTCGAQIVVLERRKGWAFYPVHKAGRCSKRLASLITGDSNG